MSDSLARHKPPPFLGGRPSCHTPFWWGPCCGDTHGCAEVRWLLGFGVGAGLTSRRRRLPIAAHPGRPGPSASLPLPAHDDLHGRQRSRTTNLSPRALPGPYSSPASLPVAFLGRYGALPVDTALDGQRVQELGSRPWMRDQPRTGRSRGRAPATAPRDLQEGGRASRVCASKLDIPLPVQAGSEAFGRLAGALHALASPSRLVECCPAG